MKIAGIDVHKKVLMVVVIDATRLEEKPERRRFTTLPGDLRRLSRWLRAQEGQEAVLESTAQYWRPVWLEWEPPMLLHLAHAFSNRAPRGRKHDFRDAQPRWLEKTKRPRLRSTESWTLHRRAALPQVLPWQPRWPLVPESFIRRRSSLPDGGFLSNA